MTDSPREKQAQNLKKTEDLLLGYLKDRKKAGADLALEALTELAPEHPRLDEYRTWVRDLDQEIELLAQLDSELTAGRAALLAGDLDLARRHFTLMKRLDADAEATLHLGEEITRSEAGEVEGADIAKLKTSFESHLEAHRLDEAEGDLKGLSRHDVPKVTLDRLRRRLEDLRKSHHDDREMEDFERLFAGHLAAGEWQKARELAHQAGERFPDHPRPAEMFHEVQVRESRNRDEESVRQGVTMLEKLLGEGKKDHAAMALKILQGKITPERYTEYERRIRES